MNTPTIKGGQIATIYVNGQVEGEWFELYSPWGDSGLGQYDVGIINIQVVNGHVQGGVEYTAPSWINKVYPNYSWRLWTTTTGQGGGQLPYQVYSDQLVNTFTSSDTTWIDVGVDVGAILALFSPELLLPTWAVLTLVGTITSSSLSNTEAWVLWNAPSGETTFTDVLVGAVTYSLSNGGSGVIPLMGVDVSAYPGTVGCVLSGTQIQTSSTATQTVDKLKAGETLLGWDTTTSSFVPEVVVSNSYSYVSQAISINDGQLVVTVNDQPLFVRNGTWAGWVANPSQLTVGEQVFEPMSGSWANVTSIQTVLGHFKVFDLRISTPSDFIANGILALDKGKR